MIAPVAYVRTLVTCAKCNASEETGPRGVGQEMPSPLLCACGRYEREQVLLAWTAEGHVQQWKEIAAER